MTSTYKIVVAGETRATFTADFAQASSPIMLDGNSTPFQVADARHKPSKAAELLIDWCDSEGGEIVGDDEEYEVEAVAEEITVYVVRDASGEYVSGSGRTPASNEADEFETREEAEEACERATDAVLARQVVASE